MPPAEEFSRLMQDLQRAPWLGEVGAVLTGYLGHPEQAAAVAELVKAVKAKNPGAVYLCDPVIGDEKGLYVPEATAMGIRDKLLPLADIATPNRFELSWLTGVPLEDNSALMEAALEAGPATMLVTSAFPRAAVYAEDYRESCSLSLEHTDPPRKVSRQAFGLFPKICEIDELLRCDLRLAERIIESHPELALRF